MANTLTKLTEALDTLTSAKLLTAEQAADLKAFISGGDRSADSTAIYTALSTLGATAVLYGFKT